MAAEPFPKVLMTGTLQSSGPGGCGRHLTGRKIGSYPKSRKDGSSDNVYIMYLQERMEKQYED
jgi:hypothetical protein